MGQDRGSVITRIASGCGAAARARVSADVRAFGSPRFRVHFTPEYAGTPAEPPPGDAAAAKVARDDAAGDREPQRVWCLVRQVGGGLAAGKAGGAVDDDVPWPCHGQEG